MTTARIDLPQGTLDLLILRTLALEPQHGWAISERIRQVSTEVLGPVAADLTPPLSPGACSRRPSATSSTRPGCGHDATFRTGGPSMSRKTTLEVPVDSNC